ncbi:glutaminase A [Gordonia neofelifaecis]|uniref:Glutaminase n=1 Tax=Gordonia neofelifaecis NRRL B-59395 TaxID=644548 RepID=F1YE29_9ACTN|nr:glutaminase A [Gordonia neofelifaecis]EGD57119.1 glutaminase [Gordonia neofelifaecis NRRL B-59395]
MIEDVHGVAQHAATGALPTVDQVRALIAAAHDRYAGLSEGVVADYIPALAQADPDLFGLSLAAANGQMVTAGDVDVAFSIQSISKAFVFALLVDDLGRDAVFDAIGVNNTGMPFNSVVAVEMNNGAPMNPMVNAGAIATSGLISGIDGAAKWQRIRDGLSAFAGRALELDDEVYRSEAANNQRNAAIAHLLASYGRLAGDPEDIVDAYTRQCSLSVTANDLAIMGATLADDGINPISGERVVSGQACRDTLAVLASCGMYERSGEWLFEIGLPAKSGVSGGIVSIAPGKGAVGSYSPPLDPAGNSVRGQRACAYLSRVLGLNLFASSVHTKVGRTSAGR